jgi:hypothetical protein
MSHGQSQSQHIPPLRHRTRKALPPTSPAGSGGFAAKSAARRPPLHSRRAIRDEIAKLEGLAVGQLCPELTDAQRLSRLKLGLYSLRRRMGAPA